MGWERYLRSGWANAQEANELEQRLAKMAKHARDRRIARHVREEELEADLGRVALLARALAELCLKKGLITPAELKAELFATDMDDGVGDQRLDPGVVMPGETKQAKPRSTTQGERAASRRRTR